MIRRKNPRLVLVLRTYQIHPELPWLCSLKSLPLKNAKKLPRSILHHFPKRMLESRRRRSRPSDHLVLWKVRFLNAPLPCLNLCSLRNRAVWISSNRHSQEEKRHLSGQPLLQPHDQRIRFHHLISSIDEILRSNPHNQIIRLQHLASRTPIQLCCMPQPTRHRVPVGLPAMSQERVYPALIYLQLQHRCLAFTAFIRLRLRLKSQPFPASVSLPLRSSQRFPTAICLQPHYGSQPSPPCLSLQLHHSSQPFGAFMSLSLLLDRKCRLACRFHNQPSLIVTVCPLPTVSVTQTFHLFNHILV